MVEVIDEMISKVLEDNPSIKSIECFSYNSFKVNGVETPGARFSSYMRLYLKLPRDHKNEFVERSKGYKSFLVAAKIKKEDLTVVAVLVTLFGLKSAYHHRPAIPQSYIEDVEVYYPEVVFGINHQELFKNLVKIVQSKKDKGPR